MLSFKKFHQNLVKTNNHNPTALGFDITYQCSQECKMCSNWKIKNDEPELTTKQIVKIVEDYIDKYEIQKVRFLGGEPFLRKDLEEIISQVPKDVLTEVVTNGVPITENRAEKIVSSGLRQIRFSIDGPRDIHDYMRGKGSFDKAVKSIDFLINERERKNSQFPLIKIHPCISKLNVDYLDWFFEFAESKKASLGILFLEAKTEDQKATIYDNKLITDYRLVDDERLKLSKTEKRIFLKNYSKRIRDSQNSYFIKLAMGIGDTVKTILPKFKSSSYKDCERSKEDAIVDPWGNQFPCEFLYNFQYGNCFKEGASIWEGEKRKKIRLEIKNGSFPTCQSCNANGSYRYPPVIFRKLKYKILKKLNKNTYQN